MRAASSGSAAYTGSSPHAAMLSLRVSPPLSQSRGSTGPLARGETRWRSTAAVSRRFTPAPTDRARPHRRRAGRAHHPAARPGAARWGSPGGRWRRRSAGWRTTSRAGAAPRPGKSRAATRAGGRAHHPQELRRERGALPERMGRGGPQASRRGRRRRHAEGLRRRAYRAAARADRRGGPGGPARRSAAPSGGGACRAPPRRRRPPSGAAGRPRRPPSGPGREGAGPASRPVSARAGSPSRPIGTRVRPPRAWRRPPPRRPR